MERPVEVFLIDYTGHCNHEIDHEIKNHPKQKDQIHLTFRVKNVTHGLISEINRPLFRAIHCMPHEVDFSYRTPDELRGSSQAVGLEIYSQCMSVIQMAYDEMIEAGVSAESARGILPINMQETILIKLSLAEIVEMANRGRASQEFREVTLEMTRYAMNAFPFIKDDLCPKKRQGKKIFGDFIERMWEGGAVNDLEYYGLKKELEE